MKISVSFGNGKHQNVILAGVPREGDEIQLSNANGGDPIIRKVVGVLWVEGDDRNDEPSIIIHVRVRD